MWINSETWALFQNNLIIYSLKLHPSELASLWWSHDTKHTLSLTVLFGALTVMLVAFWLPRLPHSPSTLCLGVLCSAPERNICSFFYLWSSFSGSFLPLKIDVINKREIKRDCPPWMGVTAVSIGLVAPAILGSVMRGVSETQTRGRNLTVVNPKAFKPLASL